MKLEIIREAARGNIKPNPLLFVHGKWHGAWCWAEHFMPYFAEHGYNSTAFSLRGHAGSEGREGLRWYSIADYVADMEQVADGFDTPPVIIGHSMGGYITQKFLETHPEIPAAALLTSVPPFGLWSTTFNILTHKPAILFKALGTLSLYPVIETTDRARWGLFSQNMPDEEVNRYHNQMQDESFRSYLDELGLNLVHPKRVKTPVLVIGAGHDMIILPKLVEATARAYGTEAEIFPGIAHDVMLEHDWERVAKYVLHWLTTRGL